MATDDMGFFGNIWVRQHTLNQYEFSPGHKHYFDHVTLLVSGTIEVEVENNTKQFIGPTYIIIRKDHQHKITALSDNVLYYCIFALRDLDGNPLDLYTPEHDPLSHATKI